MNIETRKCTDGSMTLYLPDMDETYHSVHGAITESQFVYIQAGLAQIDAQEISILEFGFGTGLNALLSLAYANKAAKRLHYYSVEKYPLAQETLDSLNYGSLLDMDAEWNRLHAAEWNSWFVLETTHALYKMHGDFEELDLPNNSIDLLSYYAFAPSKQEGVWSISYLHKAANALQTGGVLVTYCAKGQFRLDLQALGFEVTRLPGPPGKHEMIFAKLTA